MNNASLKLVELSSRFPVVSYFMQKIDYFLVKIS